MNFQLKYQSSAPVKVTQSLLDSALATFHLMGLIYRGMTLSTIAKLMVAGFPKFTAPRKTLLFMPRW
jgi:hypothetical protein